MTEGRDPSTPLICIRAGVAFDMFPNSPGINPEDTPLAPLKRGMLASNFKNGVQIPLLRGARGVLLPGADTGPKFKEEVSGSGRWSFPGPLFHYISGQIQNRGLPFRIKM